ncbi:PREDICTED: DNA annealing helicase and endonuclease ZRANB3-like [Camelina sativa]|uniref:DNA annealing helicase and endonuclease ZRANB3-like n=1 Tax=Camelina sativa TaxID=90675 RepID=A0ABM0TDG8_CAMSA|nr:PREDICTED: DNA annealing helicase and endonuclease ZRANB3-like [Camelina sativa]
MEVSEEQRQRDEANRLVLFGEKRKPSFDSSGNSQRQQDFRLAKCRKLDDGNDVRFQERNRNYESGTSVPEKFRVRLEICSPDSFSVTPFQLQGFRCPEEQECLRQLREILSDAIPSHYTQNQDGGKAEIYKMRDYSMVSGCLKRSKRVEVEVIPWKTLAVVEKLSQSCFSGKWQPCIPEHFSEEKVEELIETLPRKLVNALLPFQLDGLRFGLRRGGRCLIADEMGLGKTLQAIAIAGCFINEGSILVVCPAVLRFSWAEELERWLPFCLPSDVHLVFGHQNNPAYLPRWPKVVVISYKMLQHLRTTMLEREWALLIVDESHHLRCSKKKSDTPEIKTVLDVAEKVKHIVLLSGTPSLSRPFDIFHQINMLWPGLLGKDKYEFAKTYCEVGLVRGIQGKIFQDFSKGTRLLELNILLNQTVMIRRLKQHVLTQLPPKRRQIVTILLKKSDIALAMSIVSEANKQKDGAIAETTENSHEPKHQNARGSNEAGHVDAENSEGPETDKENQLCGKLSYQQLGIAKLSAFREWLSLHPLLSRLDYTPEEIDGDTSSTKMVIFAHHHKVLDGIQEFICDKGIGFVRIDGMTLPRDRQLAVQSFQFSSEVKVAIIGVEAGGVGLDFSAAQNVVFVELPKTPSLLLQAEDRAHRRGQTSAVNVYIICAKDTMDETNWQNLNKKLHRISSTTDGKYDGKTEIEIERAYIFKPAEESSEREVLEAQPSKANTVVADKIVESCEDLGSGTDEFICDKGIGFVRIDGMTLPRDRQLAVQSFQFSSEVKVAIIGVEAGGVGLDFSAAQNVVFVELPKTPSLLLQAEDRAHRRGQTSAVNVYIICAKDTMDETNWQNLNKKLHRISSTTDGKYDGKTEIEIERAYIFKPAEESSEREVLEAQPSKANTVVADKIVESCEDLGSGTDVSNTIDLKDDLISHLDILEACPFDENGSGSEMRSSGSISSTMLDQENQENHQPEIFIADDGLVKEDDSSSIYPLVDPLRFEVSQNTGRIHLYSCIPGKDPRPRPCFENFRPEEIEASNLSQGINKETSPESNTDDTVHVLAILEFLKEWKSLRPIEKRKLLGKPLQLPLSLELSYLSESASHNSEGLLRGGSKRRNTPFSEISIPLPASAVWKKVNLRSGHQRKEKEYTQAWSMSNEPLCKLCQKPCKGNNAKEPEYFEDLFCDLACYEDYRIRTSGRYIRQELFQIEHGICTNCKLDCHQLVRRLRPLPLEKRRKYINQVAPELFARKNLLETLVTDPTEGNAWHADHIIPVYQGGGECRLENMRTLCVACHADVTAAQCVERKVIRSEARKQLKNTLKELRNIPKQTDLSADDCTKETDSVTDEEEDELLVEVPGSSYSIDQKINHAS